MEYFHIFLQKNRGINTGSLDYHWLDTTSILAPQSIMDLAFDVINSNTTLTFAPRLEFSKLKDPITVLFLGVLTMIWVLTPLAPRRNLPPGPKPLPIIGNLFDWPLVQPWLVFDGWFKKYHSDIIHVNLVGRHVIILGSRQKCLELLERRSAKYSDRPRMAALVDIMRWDFMFGFLPYGSSWRRHRKLFNDYFHPRAVLKYKPVYLREARVLAYRFLTCPEDFLHHIRHAFTAMIMDISYGIRITGEKDPFVTVAEQAMSSLAVASVPGTTLTDIFPVIKHIPSWMPGAGFKRYAKSAAQANHIMATKPWNAAKDAFENGSGAVSMAANMLLNLPDERRDVEETIAMNTVATSYVGGSDSTITTVQTFVLAMAMYPEVQKKAQAELDTVIRHRLPTFEDRDQLPYIQAIMREALRWQPVAPMGNAHRCIADDEYEGYFIPKGSIVAANLWSILHDPEMYPNPLEFNPDRFIKDGKSNPDILDPNQVAFGFGRRVCPGRFLSDHALFITVSTLLSVFDFRPPLDEQGNPVKLEADMMTGMVSHCQPFKCRITPRSAQAEKLLRDFKL